METAIIEEKAEKKQIVKYSVTDAAIDKMEKEFLPLKLKGPDDKDGFKKIVEYKKVVRGKRLEVEAERKSLKADALEYGRRVDAEANRIKDRLQPIENHLAEQESIVKKEQERIKAEEQKKRQDRHDEQIKWLIDAGAVYNGFEYFYGTDSVSDAIIWGLSDENFELLIKGVNLWREKEDIIIVEADRIKKEETDRQVISPGSGKFIL